MRSFTARLFFSLLLTFLAPSLWAKPVIVFDAGSSGTRMYIYEVEGEKATPLHNYRVKPGLSSLDPNDTQALDQYFYDLVKSAENILDAQAKAQTPFYLYATAGMRILPNEQQESLIHAARLSLAKQAATFGYPSPMDENIRVISGTEEGVFIWISDNYLSDSFAHYFLNAHNTVAALEMGGASSEIAFLSHSAQQFTLPYEHNHHSTPIYSYGYDGLGANEAIATLSASGNPQFASCFPVEAPYPLTAPKLTGTGNFHECTAAIKDQFINPAALRACQQETPGQCSGLGVHQPSTHAVENYLLTSAFYYLFDMLGIANETVTLNTFAEKSESFCRISWEEAKAAYPNQDPNNLINYCFNAALSQTLFDAWGLDKTDNLKAVSKLNGVALEWPLGAAIYLGTQGTTD